jgi:hypothetical protein
MTGRTNNETPKEITTSLDRTLTPHPHPVFQRTGNLRCFEQQLDRLRADTRRVSADIQSLNADIARLKRDSKVSKNNPSHPYSNVMDRPLAVRIREEVLRNYTPADHELVEEEITATYGQHPLVHSIVFQEGFLRDYDRFLRLYGMHAERVFEYGMYFRTCLAGFCF